tara:strand:+ start:496 stop:723 length:228 start_codon:yes stop_codon:yes gene_type:complete
MIASRNLPDSSSRSNPEQVPYMKQVLKGGDEFDCVSNKYRSKFINNVRTGVWKSIKRKMNKRFRKEGKAETTEEQ